MTAEVSTVSQAVEGCGWKVKGCGFRVKGMGFRVEGRGSSVLSESSGGQHYRVKGSWSGV